MKVTPSNNVFCYWILAILFVFSTSDIYSQKVWLETTVSNDNRILLFDHMENKSVATTPKKELINYNPAFSFDDKTTPAVFNGLKLNQCNILTVFKPSPHSSEDLIWSIENDASDALSLTDRRMVDFTKGKFMNFVDNSPTKAQIINYQHYRSDFEGHQMKIGGKFRDQNIPVESFTGSLAEIIIFNKVLAPDSRDRIESSLAIKYSIPLEHGRNYLDAKGEIIWNAEKEAHFSNRISGLARADVFHLNQNQSMSEFGQGYIALGIENIEQSNPMSKTLQEDNSYLLWGDDDGEISFEESFGQPSKLIRNWKINSKRYSGNTLLQCDFSHKGISNNLQAGEHLWMAISKDDSFDIKASEYFRMDQSNSISSHSTKIDLADFPFEYFSFIKAPTLWAKIKTQDYLCDSGETGFVEIKPAGGQLPFHLKIKDDSGRMIESLKMHQGIIWKVEGLNQGNYHLEVKDAKGLQWESEFFINGLEVSLPDLKSRYLIEAPKNLSLDNLDRNEEVTWILPDGSTTIGSDITLSQNGRYVLIIELEGCLASYPFDVIIQEDNIKSCKVSPNPTLNGHFMVEANLQEAAPFEIIITDSSGKLISSNSYPAARYIYEPQQLPASGSFIMTLKSGRSVHSETIISTQNN